MWRFVWPVAECLEASRPVKAPDSNAGIFICAEWTYRTERAFLKPE
jgi:hypothetical protein